MSASHATAVLGAAGRAYQDVVHAHSRRQRAATLDAWNQSVTPDHLEQFGTAAYNDDVGAQFVG
jgi:hypothetical protein